jgi:pyruvate/2-oxoglutarate/acetoin dehydrogenase E1 component
VSYYSELCRAMVALSLHPKAKFIGQGVGVRGTTMSDTFSLVPESKRLEFPVAEELQLGFCTGLSLDGWLPICIFPRWNFVLRAADQLVNHLDAIPRFSDYKPKVIIRVAIPSTRPFYQGPQHDGDFTGAFSEMLRTVLVKELIHEDQIVPAYLDAASSDKSVILVEHTEMYKNERGRND